MPTQFKDSREKCWGARDTYWKCLESNDEQVEKCMKLRKDYEKLCTKQWVNNLWVQKQVKYFDRKRKYDRFKATADLNNWEMPQKDKSSQ